MRISALEVTGFRSISCARLTFDEVTVLIGGNNAGKSTLLHALRLFFEAAPKIAEDDFHRRESDSIEIIVTFDRLTTNEMAEFGSAVDKGKLTISRTLSHDKDSNLTYSVRAKSYPPFNEIRSISNKTAMRSDFNALADQTEGLDRAQSADQVLENMNAWEADHPEQLEFSYVRGFFGAPNVANGKLKKKTGVHFIPAAANIPEETSDSKRSPIISLLSEIAKQTYENQDEVRQFIEKTQSEFDSLVSPENFPHLGKISDSLTSTIQKYYSDSKLLADWRIEEGIQFSFPKPVIQVEDSGFLSGLEHVGHGLQRAALFSVIEFLAQSTVEVAEDEFDEPQSDIILLIEEPEIYQHPHKQKLISDAFRKICENFSKMTGIRFQVVFATHSEKFLDIERFHTARIIRKESVGDQVQHRISSLTIAECSKYFASLLDVKPMPDHAFLAKLHIFSREICEGFFAEKVVLVEGVTDKAIIEGVYRSLGRDNIAEGIIVVSVDGKTKMDKPLYIFNKLGIPTYAVFDSDATVGKKKQKPKSNLILQKVAGMKDPAEFPHGCFPNFTAFEQHLEGYLKEVSGSAWEEQFDKVSIDLGLDISDICKTPQAVSRVVEVLRGNGAKFDMFDQIVERIDGLEPLL